jgi:Flp pilus assembly pilin Flp
MKRIFSIILELFIKLIRLEDGQATVEYAILASMIVTVFILFNKAFYDLIQETYEVYAFILSLPIP